MNLEDRARTAVVQNPDNFHRDFYDWMKANFVMYEHFHKEALRCANAGVKHIGSSMIVENIRYRTKLKELPGGEFKVNNNIKPDLPRLFALLEPAHKELFEFRKLNPKGKIAI